MILHALRLAELPGEGISGRLLIRHLDLGRFSSQESPRQLAQRLTTLLKDAAAHAVPLTAPAARASQSVKTCYAFEESIELVRAACRSRSVDTSAWFWPRLFAGMQRTTESALAQRLALARLWGRTESSLWASELFGLLVRDGTAARFLLQLTAADEHEFRRWLPSSSGPTDTSALALRAAAELSVPRGPMLDLAARFVPLWGPEDARSIWLCCVALSTAGSARTIDSLLVQRAMRLATALAVRAAANPRLPVEVELAVSSGSNGGVGSGLHVERDADVGDELLSILDGAAVAGDFAEKVPATTAPVKRPLETAAAAQRGKRVSAPTIEPTNALQERQRMNDWQTSVCPIFTEYAGLFFLLSILRRLQIERFLVSHPWLAECDLGRRWLSRVCERLEIPSDDPVMAVLKPLAAAPSQCRFVVPAAWVANLFGQGPFYLSLPAGRSVTRASAGCGTPLALWNDVEPRRLAEMLGANQFTIIADREPPKNAMEVLLDACEAALTRWIETYTELTLPSLVRRAGGVLLSRTHLDVVFDIEESDASVRRAALDINPGYLPWFGRVVTFHYLRAPQFAAAASSGSADESRK